MEYEDIFEMLAEEGSMNTVLRRRVELCRNGRGGWVQMWSQVD